MSFTKSGTNNPKKILDGNLLSNPSFSRKFTLQNAASRKALSLFIWNMKCSADARDKASQGVAGFARF